MNKEQKYRFLTLCLQSVCTHEHAPVKVNKELYIDILLGYNYYNYFWGDNGMERKGILSRLSKFLLLQDFTKDIVHTMFGLRAQPTLEMSLHNDC